MQTWQIWGSGYVTNGERGGAQLFGTAEGKTFREACDTFFTDKNPERYYEAEQGYYWACKLHDNEADARKAFG